MQSCSTIAWLPSVPTGTSSRPRTSPSVQLGMLMLTTSTGASPVASAARFSSIQSSMTSTPAS